MDIYMVGGAVRDAWLGLPVHERDWVVVGATPEALVAQGYLPVGKDFPVFLHPHTREEYALARTERKTAPGYHGFTFHADPGVTLEQDLARRDLTINSIATKPIPASGEGDFYSKNLPGPHPDLNQLVDPFGGVADLQAKVLRHVGPAFTEDPVRILRLARFAARLTDFSVAPETTALMCDMVAAGEVDHLVPERVWQEVSRGLMESRPSRMFEVLRSCGALAVLLPELDRLWGVPQRADYHPEVDTGVHMMLVMDMAAQLHAPLTVRFACLCHDLGKGTTPADVLPRHIGHEERSVRLLQRVCERWRVPKDCKELADVVAREHGNVHRSGDFSAAARVRLLERCDALRRPERFAQVLLACECDARGRGGLAEQPYPQRPRLLEALAVAQRVETAAIAAQVAEAERLRSATDAAPAPGQPRKRAALGEQIAHALHTARVAALKAAGLDGNGPTAQALPTQQSHPGAHA
ncbi:MAG: multifunctional CCA addition/repair protein [Burkholderiaceae bacterium]|nr:multifunctional CCA addition/repair protein [Burkholderiaceae bacterium]